MADHTGLRFGILTVSDRCYQHESVDESGENLKNYIEVTKRIGNVMKRKCIPDEVSDIKSTLMKWSDEDNLDIILTTGGTGFSSRDVTPEATKAILEKEAPGIVIAIITKSLDITKMAMLSRAACGIRKNVLIINLPGSAKGCVESLDFVAEQLKHAVDLIRNKISSVSAQHKKMCSAHHHVKSAVDACNVAGRDRKSQFISIEVTKAQEIVLRLCDSQETEIVSLRSTLGRILAEDVYANDPLPPFRASVKDGYAVKVNSDIKSQLLEVIGDSTAGDAPESRLLTGTNCMRVSTGAAVPDGADAVVQVEHTELVKKTEDGREEKTIRILVQPSIGQDIRPIGSDISEGSLVLGKGVRLGPAELGILASVGAYKLPVFKKPVIALLSTGNELQDSMEPDLKPGKVRDSNKTTLEAIFKQEGYETVDVGIARDTPDEVYSKLLEALEAADVVVSTGGVSMGERDFLKQVLVEDLKAEVHFGSVLMKPGKPTKFFTLVFNGRKKIIFGLPGNPVSATVTAILFAIPACRKLSGWMYPFQSRIKATLSTRLRLDNTRPEYLRGLAVWEANSAVPVVYSTGNQASSRLASCIRANVLVCLPQGKQGSSEIEEGAIVECILLSHY